MGFSQWVSRKRTFATIAALSLVAPVGLHGAGASTTTINANQDTWINSQYPNDSEEGSSFIATFSNQPVKEDRAFVKFQSVPGGIYSSVKLRLNVTQMGSGLNVFQATPFAAKYQTWNYQPTISTLLGSVPKSAAGTIDISLNPQIAAGGGEVDLALYANNASGNGYTFITSIEGGKPAQLLLESGGSTTTTQAAPPVTTATTRASTTTTASATTTTLVGGQNEIRFNSSYTTAYDWWDNNPPQSAIISGPTIHSQAGGTGTFADPLTVAVADKSGGGLQFPYGTKFYVPNVRAYLIAEDRIGELANDTHPHLDMWADGKTSTQQSAFDCMSHVTTSSALVIQNPASNYAVVPGPLSANNTCRTLYGNTVVTTGGGTTTTTRASTTTTRASTTTTQAAPPVTTTTTRPSGTTNARPPAAGYFTTINDNNDPSTLPSDAACAAAVHRSTWEPRHVNDAANARTPQNQGQSLTAFYADTIDRIPHNYKNRVTGNFTGTTDEIIQWASCKWGFEDNYFRAEGIQETGWNQTAAGDVNNGACPPTYAIYKNGGCAASYGFLQQKYQYHPAAWPMYQLDTAFELDYALAQFRQYFDGYHGTSANAFSTIQKCWNDWYAGVGGNGASYVSSVTNYYNSKPWLSWAG
jgi:hypothetical protein